MKSLTIYYSWPNISAAKNNNTFSYYWPATGLIYPVVLADGIWQFSEMQSYLEQVMLREEWQCSAQLDGDDSPRLRQGGGTESPDT